MQQEKHLARFWVPMNNKYVQCLLCPHECKIKPGKRGVCGVRSNHDGELYTDIYGRTSGVGIDPIEKKPLFHFMPGAPVMSFGTWGCNFQCDFCQNWQISQNPDGYGQYFSPQEAVDLARSKNCRVIAYTYSEPMIWIEWMFETAQLAHAHGIKNVIVSNGYVNESPLLELTDFLDAANIDIKSFDENFYRKYCKGHLEWPKKTVEILSKRGIAVEVTMLIIPTLNDQPADIGNFISWVESVNPNIPVHFSRYFPQYKMDLPPTPEKTLVAAYDIARRRLPYVYLGNIQINNAEDTVCPNCKTVVISRSGYHTTIKALDKNGGCARCGHKLPIIP